VMATPTDKLIKIRDGEVVLYRRGVSPKWQVRYKLPDNKWHRTSTRRTQLDEAKRVAGEAYDKARFRHSEGLNAVSRRFRDVAQLTIEKMDQAVQAGKGKRTYKDYRQAIDNYLIPFFGSKAVDKITEESIAAFEAWRVEKMEKEPAKSTISNHNAALNRVFDTALQQGWMQRKNVPELTNTGKKGKRRPTFTVEEWRKLRSNLRHWVNKTNMQRSVAIRELMWDYVLIVANTGMRPGTETYNLKWKQVRWSTSNTEDRYLLVAPSGKTGERELVARHGCDEYFKRLQSRFPDLAELPFDDLLKSNSNEYVFRLRAYTTEARPPKHPAVTHEATRTKNLFSVFNDFLVEHKLLKDPHGENRTLYSLRHMYATMRIVEDGISAHELATQMGTSVAMIERFYSHLKPIMIADKLAGKRYEPKATKKSDESLEPEGEKPLKSSRTTTVSKRKTASKSQ
jgi:integrase